MQELDNGLATPTCALVCFTKNGKKRIKGKMQNQILWTRRDGCVECQTHCFSSTLQLKDLIRKEKTYMNLLISFIFPLQFEEHDREHFMQNITGMIDASAESRKHSVFDRPVKTGCKKENPLVFKQLSFHLCDYLFSNSPSG